ncbi:MAG: type II toxin-antitoxin system prevent-host-death family antitoxin [Rhodomicrobium sp.]
MTTKRSESSPASRRASNETRGKVSGSAFSGRWQLRDAKARLSEVITLAHNQGPQRVTVRGGGEVVIVASDDYERLRGGQSGQALIDALAASPLRGADFEREAYRASVRDVEL